MNRLTALFRTLFLFQRGRFVATLLLLGFATAAWHSEDDGTSPRTGLPSAIAEFVAPLTALRQWLFDGYQHSFPRQRGAQTVAVVGIDEKSLHALGQWPWPRDQLAQLVDAIAAQQPAAIGLDIYMPEADQTSPARIAARLGTGQELMARQLRALPDHDTRLAEALRKAPVVLGAAAFDFETLTTTRGLRTRAVAVAGEGDALQLIPRFTYVLASLPQLQAAAPGQALVSIDVQQTVVRRVPLVAAIGEHLVPALSMEMLRLATGSDNVKINISRHGVQTVAVADLAVPTQASGDVWLHFAQSDLGRVRNVSAADVLSGNVNPDMLAHKLVLVGLTGLGLNDFRATPLGEKVPGIEIQAQLLESLLDGRFLQRPLWLRQAELALILGFGALMLWRVPVALRRGLRPPRTETSGQRQPQRVDSVGWLVTGGVALLVALGYFMFWMRGWLFDSLTPALGFALLLACLVSSAILQVESDNQQLENERRRLREQAARVAGEMEAARRIQLGTLPQAATEFPDEHRFEVAALMEPARAVGGDLYDFFKVDAHKVYFVVGDVSGKGLPASLFMVLTKTLIRSLATRLDTSFAGPAQVVAAVNEDLERENAESLFVTLLLGVLDAKSGAVLLVNAGHDAPWLLRQGQAVAQVQAVASAGGPPLCVLPGFAYPVQQLQLQPGDALFLATDGITEATNLQGLLYGSERLQAALQTALPMALQASPAQPGLANAIVKAVYSDLTQFVGGAEPSDDITTLVLRWNGPNGR